MESQAPEAAATAAAVIPSEAMVARLTGGMARRQFLQWAGGGTLALLGPQWKLLAAAQPADGDLAAAYREHLRLTKGILDIRTFHQAGSGPNFLDVVVVSAGFTADQMAEFHAVCEKFKSKIFSVQPWARYQGIVNIHGVFVADESPDVTRLKTSGYKGQVLGCDNGVAVEYARYAANAAGTLVFHNSTFSRGGAGIWGVAVCNKSNADQAMVPTHELGHGMAGLGDEYIQRQEPFTDAPETLQDTINVTAEPDPKRCKWHYWAPDEWPGLFGRLPRPAELKVANFEGAGWIKGIYRPENGCIMRCNRDAFCVVCSETMETSLFRYIDLFKTVEPAQDNVVLWKGETLNVRVAGIDLLRQPPAWLKSRTNMYLDGRTVARSDSAEVAYQLDGAKPGIYQLGVSLNVQSDTVRQDFGFLAANRGWRVNVLPHRKPGLTVKPAVTVAPGGTVDVPVVIRHDKPSLFQLQMAHAPAGAVLENGRFKWKPTGSGSWRVDFVLLLDKLTVVTAALDIHVAGAAAAGETIEVPSHEPVDVVTAAQGKFQLKAVAKDGGHLLYTAAEVPAGVEVNRETGEVLWTPVLSQAGPQRLRFKVHNGVMARDLEVVARVRRAATPAPVSYCNSYIPQTLAALKQLQQNPVVYRRMFETLRLLRDRYGRIYQPALAEARTMFAELKPELRNNCLQELHLHAWAFANKPEILKWLREVAGSSEPKVAAVLAEKLNQIDDYNTKRITVASK